MKEYKIIAGNVSNDEHRLQIQSKINDLAREGWEVKFVVPSVNTNYVHIYTLERFIAVE